MNENEIELAKEQKEEMLVEERALLAKNSTNPEILEKLSNDENISVRVFVADNPNTPPDVLDNLSNDDASIKASVARNENTSTETLEKLSTDNKDYVRSAVADNPNTPPDVLDKLSEDKDLFVKGSVAKNENTPIEVIEKLAHDDTDHIRAAAAQNKNLSVETLETLSNDKDIGVLIAVAGNSNTPPDVLDKLSENSFPPIRNAVAENENTTMNTLNSLSRDEHENVAASAQKNLENKEAEIDNFKWSNSGNSLSPEAEKEILAFIDDFQKERQETSFPKDQIDNFMEARENGSLERLEGETKEFELAKDLASITDKNSGETEYVSSKEAFSQMIEDQSIDRDKIFEAANNLQNTGELEKAGEERLFNNAVEAVQNEGIDKSNEGLAIDTVKEFNTAYGNEASNERLAEMANDKFGTEFKAEDIQEIKNLDEKQMNGDVQIDRKEDLDMDKVKDLNSGKEIEVQGDHATIKEQTMAGEASERVVSREGGLDELDKTAGKDSDKVETREENEQRDGLSAKEAEILQSINEDRKGSLNDAIDEYKSDSSNREVSVSQGQNSSESTKQK